MDEAYKKQATEWFERGQHDLETTQLILDHSGHPDTAAYHVHQDDLEVAQKICMMILEKQ